MLEADLEALRQFVKRIRRISGWNNEEAPTGDQMTGGQTTEWTSEGLLRLPGLLVMRGTPITAPT